MSKINQTLGVLGGGQLGRMLIQSAIDFNLDVHILDPGPNAPCSQIATQFTAGSITDEETVYQFGQQCDLITIEIENVNTAALKRLRDEGKKVFPQPEVIELIQDKRVQKQFYERNEFPTAEFTLIDNQAELYENVHLLPGVNKLGKAGYDGRGVQIIRTEEELARGFDAPGLLERLIDFDKEISVIVSRNESGQVKTFPVVELAFHPIQNLVEFLFSPSTVALEIQEKAEQLAIDIIEKLDMVGLLAVEMFVTKDGQVLVNEMAPRTHNSGHHTIEANQTSQFEQHLRAILNLPPGATDILVPAAMVNLLGEPDFTGLAKYEGLDAVLALSGTHVHLYGKKMTKPFRKMGHVTVTDPDIDSLRKKVDFVKETLKVVA